MTKPQIYDDQVGGDHYKQLRIEPAQYAIENRMGWAEGEIVKYVTRWRLKGGLVDLNKAQQVLSFLIEHESRMAAEEKGEV